MAKRQIQRRRNARRRRGGQRANATAVLAPGAAAVPKRAFGFDQCHYSLACWDAKSLYHLPLPRATGPYTVIRVTRRISNNARLNVFGTYYEGDRPSTTCCISDQHSAQPINGASNAFFYANDLGGIGKAATIVPSAFSLQIMNPNSLQHTSGVIYAGVMSTQAAIGNRTDSWEEWGNKFVEFQSPRIMTAPKLALRGVQINSYPLNMSQIADFGPAFGVGQNEGVITWTSESYHPKGFAPIVVYNATGETPPQLEYLVTTEYRVRFDLDNVASASHKQHPVASDRVWADLMAKATSLGNGVIDIVEGVANMGEMAQRGLGALGRARAAQLALAL